MEKPYAYLLMKYFDYEPPTPISIYWTLEDAIKQVKGFFHDEENEDDFSEDVFSKFEGFEKTEDGANFIGVRHHVNYSIEKIEVGMAYERLKFV